MLSKRPEYQAPPDIFYNETEARKYTDTNRIMDIQVKMTERAMELLCLPEDKPCLLLDLGCGSGLSGSVLEEEGHTWVGLDISQAMLNIALEREVEGDLILSDLGQGLPFRAGVFDGAISISMLQWLCNADKISHHPIRRIAKFFSLLYTALSPTSRAVFQFYPENVDQVEIVTSQATRAGFFGGLVIDYPNSNKVKKYFLVLMTGVNVPLPKALGTDSESSAAPFTNKRQQFKTPKFRSHSRLWVLQKKERRRKKGKETRRDSKYSGRKRPTSF